MKKELRLLAGLCLVSFSCLSALDNSQIGKEVPIPVHLKDGEELQMSIPELVAFGTQLFQARWTTQEGQGRPLTKGMGNPLSDLSSSLTFPRNFDRLSGPDSNSCSGCHNTPFPGGGGDRVSEVFVLGQRFDFMGFDHSNAVPTRGVADEQGTFTTAGTAFNEKKTIGMNGSGFIEMLARQITADLQRERNATPPGTSVALVSKAISFGTLIHNADGSWDVSQVKGLAARPGDSRWRDSQSGRQAVPPSQKHRARAPAQHLGLQSTSRHPERGTLWLGVDTDGDGREPSSISPHASRK